MCQVFVSRAVLLMNCWGLRLIVTPKGDKKTRFYLFQLWLCYKFEQTFKMSQKEEIKKYESGVFPSTSLE